MDRAKLNQDPNSFDFGAARAGEIVQHVFYLLNSEPEEKRVADVQTFCGCTTADVVGRVIQPNGQLEVSVGVNTAGKRGRISEKIWVKLSDESRRVYTVTGFVYNQELPAIKLDYSGDSGEDFATFSFDWPEYPNFKILDTTYERRMLSVHREDKPDRKGSFFTVSLLPPRSYGIYMTRVTIQTNDPFEPEYFVPIEGYIPFPIEPETFSIAVGRLQPRQSKAVKTTISAPYGGQLEVTGVRYAQGIPGTWQIHRLGSGSVQLEFEVIVPEKPAHDAIITKIDVDAALPDYRRSFQIEAIGVLFDI